ncbi:MAG: NAD+ synthase [bacterium]|nr:NAD+ synthase [bacterium]
MRIALAQFNTTVGDIDGNARLIVDWAQRAADSGCDLVVTPELALTGYPPQDLLLKRHFVSRQLARLELLAGELPIPALVGFVDRHAQNAEWIYNAAALIADGSIKQVVHKTLLPTYDVFNELRYFKPASNNAPIQICGMLLGVTICEDLWDEGYSDKVVLSLKQQGAQLIINLSSSPFHLGKGATRIALLKRHAIQSDLPILYCNLVGAQDELIFDGDSLVMGTNGDLIARGKQFAENLVVVEVESAGTGLALSVSERSVGPVVRPGEVDAPLLLEFPLQRKAERGNEDGGVPPLPREPDFGSSSELSGALILGIRDYFRKCGFTRAVIGLSGGIDSAVTAWLAATALDARNVIGVAMPSRYNAPESTRDAKLLAEALGMEFHVLPIERSIELAMQRYTAEFGAYNEQLTAENLQARERGKTLMEISNDRGALVLSTGNKTEYALGYTTLYGDMCGGLAVLGDVSKPQVYELGHWINAQAVRDVIPAYTLSRPPSAELRSGQVDPFEYDRISPLANLVVEEHLSRAELLARGYSAKEVDLVLGLVQISEYKRQQAPPILRVSEHAFGIGRRMPIANSYRE